jgi:DNA-binding response OmpR family regulator
MEQVKKRLTVGSGGIDPRDVRLIEIVFRHSQYNPIEFELQTRLELKTAEVLLINPMTPEGLKALAKLRTSGLNIPVISVVQRGASPGSKYAIALDRLTLQLLPMLNKVVEEHYGHDNSPSHSGKQVAGSTGHDFANDHLRRQVSEATKSAHLDASTRSVPTDNLERMSRFDTPPQVAELAKAVQAGAQQLGGESAPQKALELDSPGQEIWVLIVDDSPTVRSQLTIAVQKLGMSCHAVPSALEAIKLCQARHFDLALVDVIMPDIDGYKLTKEIRRHFKSTPVIILTSKSSPFDLARGALAGCDTYLVKPVTMQKLKDTMFKSLRKSMAIDDVEAVLQAQLARRALAIPVLPLNSSHATEDGNPASASNVRVLPMRDLARTA